MNPHYQGETKRKGSKDGKIDMMPKKNDLEAKWKKEEEAKKKECMDSKYNLETALKKIQVLQEQSKKLEKEKEIIEMKRKIADEKAKSLQAQHYDRTKNIKVTDDDFSTIIAKLGKFSGKLSNFPPNSKSSFKKNLSREEIIQFFINNNKENEEQIKFLFQQDLDKIDYALVSVLVEKLITKEIVQHIYKAAIHLDSKVNEAFLTIQKLLKETNHESWINEFRLKIAKATYDLIHRYDTSGKAKEIHNMTRENVIQSIVKQLIVIYDKEEDIRSRIEKLVDMAIDLSLPIRGQEDLVEIIDLNYKDNVYKNQVKPMYRQFDKDQIIIGISPVFLAKSIIDEENQSGNEDDLDISTYLPNHTLVYPGKAIY